MGYSVNPLSVTEPIFVIEQINRLVDAHGIKYNDNVNEWMNPNKWMNESEWMHEWTNERMNESEWMSELLLNGWMNE